MTDNPVPSGIDAERVTKWLDENVEGCVGPYGFDLIAGGHSNLTFSVRPAEGPRLVLRRPPLGQVLATAHDMEREHRIITGVGSTSMPVPRAVGLCTDIEVNGAPFYVMVHVDGPVLHSDEEAAEVDEIERASLGVDVIEVLAQLHSIEPDDVGLGDLGKREDYLGRQLRRWSRQWEQSKTRDLQAMEDVQALLAAEMPEQVGSAIVHGDYRLGNMIVGRGKVCAVLDWELCTLGDPLADVGYLMNNWVAPGETQASSSAPTLAGGFGEREHLLAHYAELTRRDVSAIDYYRAFSFWRLAAIVEGVLKRYLGGVMGDSEADTEYFRLQVEDLATRALELLRP
ncbi:MAG: phosphotransferase family protein [Actinomycetia bacterium]|nr:phosphotransferase family protein [Actinomycetes bacterium]MCP4961826.1 phosphotransferase family protein [Actinomycetes bacterium]